VSDRPLILAHRGDWRQVPENSLAALLAGSRAPGSDGVEFDVRLSRDGVPVVIHDHDLLRVQGVPRAVGDLTGEELSGHGVPSLSDVVLAIPRDAFLDIELKEVPNRAVVEAIAAGRGPDLARGVISSFEGAALRRMMGLAPRWPRWLIAEAADDAVLARAADLRCRGLAVRWESIDEAAARAVSRAGLELAAWTVRRQETVEWLARLGVAAV